MKKSIGIIAAVVLSASVYSQNYDPANPHSTQSSSQSDSSSVPSYSSRAAESAPGPAEFDAQSSLRAKAEENNNSSERQGLSLTDEEAAESLRNSDDTDLANRNQEEGLTDPDRALNSVDTQEPDLIYEEWILITPEDVGRPGEAESGTDSSSEQRTDVPNEPEMDDHGEFSSRFDRETGILNDERIHNGGNYSDDYVGAPGSAETGAAQSSKEVDDCEVEHTNRSLESSSSTVDRDERLNLERESVGGPAEAEFGVPRSSDDEEKVQRDGSEPADDDRYRINRSESEDRYHINRDDSSGSNTIPPDL